MKLFVAFVVMSSVFASFASADRRESIQCRSLEGAKTDISLSASDSDGNPGVRARIVIDGSVGRIDNQQESNDASVDINMLPSQNIIGMDGDLTSDDAKDVHIKVDAKLETVKMPAGSTDLEGSATFIGVLDAEIDQHVGNQTRVIREAKAQLVSCQASWDKNQQ